MHMNLSDMKAGDCGRVVGYDKSFLPYRQKLLAMGLTPGTEFKIMRVAPLGDPIEIRVRGTDLSVRPDEVAGLRIERLDKVPPAPKPVCRNRITPSPSSAIPTAVKPRCSMV